MCVGLCVCACVTRLSLYSHFSIFLIRLKTKAPVIREGSSTQLVSHQTKNIFSVKTSSLKWEKNRKHDVKPPLGRYCIYLRVLSCLFFIFHSLALSPTSVLSLWLLLCVDFLLHFALDPLAFISFLFPLSAPLHESTFEFIIMLDSQCNGSLQK